MIQVAEEQVNFLDAFESDNDASVVERKWLVPVIATAILIVLVGGVGITAVVWPKSYEKPHNCSWIPDPLGSYCFDQNGTINDNGTNCIYYWDVVIDDVPTFERWQCDQRFSNCTFQGWTSNSTLSPPHPNNTLCYRPPTCVPSEGEKWWEGWNCQPIFSTTVYYNNRATFLYFTLSAIGILYVGGMLSYYDCLYFSYRGRSGFPSEIPE